MALSTQPNNDERLYVILMVPLKFFLMASRKNYILQAEKPILTLWHY
jgi:hypothetical protein